MRFPVYTLFSFSIPLLVLTALCVCVCAQPSKLANFASRSSNFDFFEVSARSLYDAVFTARIYIVQSENGTWEMAEGNLNFYFGSRRDWNHALAREWSVYWLRFTTWVSSVISAELYIYTMFCWECRFREFSVFFLFPQDDFPQVRSWRSSSIPLSWQCRSIIYCIKKFIELLDDIAM